MRTDNELLSGLVGEWKKKAKQAQQNLEGTKIDRMKYMFGAQMKAFEECAQSLQATINADRDYQKRIR